MFVWLWHEWEYLACWSKQPRNLEIHNLKHHDKEMIWHQVRPIDIILTMKVYYTNMF
jgi:hypothetical protein